MGSLDSCQEQIAVKRKRVADLQAAGLWLNRPLSPQEGPSGGAWGFCFLWFGGVLGLIESRVSMRDQRIELSLHNRDLN